MNCLFNLLRLPWTHFYIYTYFVHFILWLFCFFLNLYIIFFCACFSTSHVHRRRRQLGRLMCTNTRCSRLSLVIYIYIYNHQSSSHAYSSKPSTKRSRAHTLCEFICVSFDFDVYQCTRFHEIFSSFFWFFWFFGFLLNANFFLKTHFFHAVFFGLIWFIA